MPCDGSDADEGTAPRRIADELDLHGLDYAERRTAEEHGDGDAEGSPYGQRSRLHGQTAPLR